MSDHSAIEWTDATWNPVRGCSKISPGCKHCYAQTFAERWRGTPGHPYEQGFDLRIVPEKLVDPLHWARPRMIFVNSMSDLLHKGVPDSYVSAVFDTMVLANWHIYQMLTKRARRLRNFIRREYRNLADHKHIWLGVSVEDRRWGLPRIDELRATPAGVRFLSIEPLLEDLGTVDLRGIDWVIVGGESGVGARPMKPEWALSIRDQCQAADVPFFFKQWGGIRKKLAGRLLDGQTYDELPEIRRAPLPARRERSRRVEIVEQAAACL